MSDKKRRRTTGSRERGDEPKGASRAKLPPYAPRLDWITDLEKAQGRYARKKAGLRKFRWFWRPSLDR